MPDKGLEMPEKEGQVKAQLHLMDAQLTSLAKVQTALDAKLGPVLRRQEPTKEAECKEEELVGMANILRDFNHKLYGITQFVESMINRCEL